MQNQQMNFQAMQQQQQQQQNQNYQRQPFPNQPGNDQLRNLLIGKLSNYFQAKFFCASFKVIQDLSINLKIEGRV